VRVAIYARVSTERQEERGTVGSQLELLRAAARADGDDVVAEFVDDGYSGARLDRPALDRLRDAAEAGALDALLCLCPDRLARAYAYQVLILEELERFGVQVRFLDGPAPGDDPQARLLVQVQGVIAEYERAKIAERYRRGKLHRARAGEVFFWKVPYGYRRVAPAPGRPAHAEIYEPEAEIVRAIFHAYVEDARSIRQVAHDLYDRAIPSPTGKPIWGTSTLQRLLANEAYIGRVYYNRRETINRAPAHRGARRTKTRYRERPREEWIAIPVPAIIDHDTFKRAQRVRRENPKWSPRGVEPGHWLLRGLIECGHCHVGCNCHKMRGRNGTFHRYYYCRNHDILRAGGEHLRCPERNIRADELDAYVFAQVRRALLQPAQLIAGERTVITSTPPNDDDLIAAQLATLERKLEQAELERVRLLDAYQAALLDLDELTRRTATLTARRDQLAAEHADLTDRRADLARENRLRRGIAGFAERVLASLDNLDFDGRQRLLRLVVEKVRVTGWHVEIHLKIPLQDDPPPDREPRPPKPGPGPSSDMGLRSVDGEDLCVVNEPVDHRDGGDLVAEDLAPGRERLVAGDDQRGALVARRDQREHQVGGLGIERDVAHLVDDQQRDERQPAQLGVEVVVAFGVGQPPDPFGRSRERDALAGQAGADRNRDRQVGLAGAGRVGVELLMLLIRCRSGSGWRRRRVSCAGSSLRCSAGGRGLASWCCVAG
jgi:site-specific DNA recombinase